MGVSSAFILLHVVLHDFYLCSDNQGSVSSNLYPAASIIQIDAVEGLVISACLANISV